MGGTIYRYVLNLSRKISIRIDSTDYRSDCRQMQKRTHSVVSYRDEPFAFFFVGSLISIFLFGAVDDPIGSESDLAAFCSGA